VKGALVLLLLPCFELEDLTWWSAGERAATVLELCMISILMDGTCFSGWVAAWHMGWGEGCIEKMVEA
jgi:hypothetical protein